MAPFLCQEVGGLGVGSWELFCQNELMQIPGDKSISIRFILLASIAEGVSVAENCLVAEDSLAAINAMRQLGVQIEVDGTTVTVHGVGAHGLQAPKEPIDCSNSGTTMRLLMGLLAGQRFTSELIGDGSLSQRPMLRVAEPLRQMGANIELTDQHAPIKISPVKNLQAIEYELPIASAQVQSAILLADLYAQGVSKISGDEQVRDHTRRMFELMRIDDALQPVNITIPGDISAAMFHIVKVLLLPGSQQVFKHIGINPKRIGALEILKLMGAKIELINVRQAFEPIADIKVSYSNLSGIEIPKELIVSAIDEFPILLIAAAFAKGTTVLRNAQELRVKETDRIAAMAKNLTVLVIEVQEYPDGLAVMGGEMQSGTVDSFGDHRIAMAFLIANALSLANIAVLNQDCIATSYPNFRLQ